jgi:hypothetical protein
MENYKNTEINNYGWATLVELASWLGHAYRWNREDDDVGFRITLNISK